MPTGTRVDDCYQKLKLTHGDAHASRICKHGAKAMSYSQRVNAGTQSLTTDERKIPPQLLTPPECKGCKHRNVGVFENTPPTIGAGAA